MSPGGTTLDLESRGQVRSRVLNFSVPGGFEPQRAPIQARFAEHPPRRTGA